MRFLYGDSAPFPLGYNFLATLEAFMTAATRIVQLDLESRELARQTEDMAQVRVKGMEALDQFHTVVMRAVQDTAQKVQHAHAIDYASKVGEFAQRLIDDHKRTAIASNEREAMHRASENERRGGEQRAALETFLKVARLPVLGTHVSMHLVGEGKELQPQMGAVFSVPDGIQTSFKLGASKVPTWTQARRVGEFAENMNLMVGIDKSWLRGTVTPKEVNVDEWFIMELDASEELFQLTLKKKPQDKESLVFELGRTEQGLVGRVEHPGAANAEAMPGALGGNDLQHLERLWLALRTTTRDVLEQKEQLLDASLDGQPIFENGLVVQFVVRLVNMFAPTVREIAKRSPNEFELSLKQENDDGRREEVYLRKEGLISKLQPLGGAGRQVFAPLGLDSWVPGLTTAPPPVVAATMSVPPPAPSSSAVMPPSGPMPAPTSAPVPASAPPAPASVAGPVSGPMPIPVPQHVQPQLAQPQLAQPVTQAMQPTGMPVGVPVPAGVPGVQVAPPAAPAGSIPPAPPSRRNM